MLRLTVPTLAACLLFAAFAGGQTKPWPAKLDPPKGMEKAHGRWSDPDAHGHYDLDNGEPVLSTIEDWRIGSGPGGKDVAKPFANRAFREYRDLAPDCMGAWLVYWRQNRPGLANKQKDAAGKAMKNWMPFLFY